MPAAPVVPVALAPPPVTVSSSHVDGPDYHTWWDWPLWHALGLCEEGLGGPDGIQWTTDTGLYVGGFAMMRTGAYDVAARELGLNVWYVDHDPHLPGWQAPGPGEQILVARQGHYVHDWYWGCGKRVPGW